MRQIAGQKRFVQGGVQRTADGMVSGFQMIGAKTEGERRKIGESVFVQLLFDLVVDVQPFPDPFEGQKMIHAELSESGPGPGFFLFVLVNVPDIEERHKIR